MLRNITKILPWLLGLPVFIFINEARRAAATLCMIVFTGARVQSFSWLPTFDSGGWLGFDHLTWQGGVQWLILAAPYLADLLTFTAFFILLMSVPLKRRILYQLVTIFGMLMPILNSGFDYFGAIFQVSGVDKLLSLLPYAEIVHLYFVASVAFYVVAFQYELRNGATALYLREQEQNARQKERLEKKKKKQHDAAQNANKIGKLNS